MKKVLAFLLLTACLLGLCGCESPGEPPTFAPAVEVTEQPAEKEWTEQDLLSSFTAIKEENWSMTDCVLFSDKAYGCVGAVLFQHENGTAHVAFFDEEGGHQQCGFGDRPADEPELRYLGNGLAAFKLQTDDGTVYGLKLSFSREGSNVYFKAESELN